LLNPVLAAAAMAMSSVSVVTNSLRLRGFTPPRDAEAILHPGLGQRVREWGYLAAIATLALAVGLGAFWSSQRAMGDAGHGMATSGDAPVTAAAAGVRVEWSATPAQPQPGQPVALRYRVVDTASGRALTDLPISHDKPMHLILVSKDLTQFQHIHPTIGSDGGDAYTVVAMLPQAGEYVLYDEFERDGRTVLDQRTLTVGAASALPGGAANLTVALAPQVANGVTVALAAPSDLRAGQEAQFTFTLTRDGSPVSDLQPYLAAAAHVAIVSADASDFVHTHGEAGEAGHGGAMTPPASFGPQVSFEHTFARPGLYKVWAQFNQGGQVLTVPFVVEVR